MVLGFVAWFGFYCFFPLYACMHNQSKLIICFFSFVPFCFFLLPPSHHKGETSRKSSKKHTKKQHVWFFPQRKTINARIPAPVNQPLWAFAKDHQFRAPSVRNSLEFLEALVCSFEDVVKRLNCFGPFEMELWVKSRFSPRA